ncbi:Ast2p NDAI_0A01640 [Naumovozyma dairenensis CBS 421]|uniref:Enoyl reductase (ER) domain-containing protein n=1 Tax=Naumovozyma dairenensis (strain ATCC 10597 / BCRC 20456 / CBS 421 / NBRC 0211 / NRRL Y-12639) TaxID=1071378 RepID=G0W3D4_NAUDC|nr:hypothetical protein NDAI_0A01640 [Naumovozyma dairenensis CBS 421]CCD22322.1 hypothetical protein NDAI_0A01640 [Naumovozyma dairenensis CBS 421]
MVDKILKNQDPVLENILTEHEVPAPKEIPVDEVKLQRVARPLRHVKHIPVKALTFHSKTGPMEFSYEKKIKIPIPKDKLVVQVNYVGLNPIDMKIRNGYTSAIYGEVGIGREYSGTVTEVGSKIQHAYHVGDEVFGIYYHPHLAVGSLQSAILVDPSVDPILLRPVNLKPEAAAGSLYCLGAAFNLLDKIEKAGYLKTDSNVLINGGTTSVGMFVLQLLKHYYNLQKKIVIVTSGTGPNVLKDHFTDIGDDFIFIDYLGCRGKASRPIRKMFEKGEITNYDPVTNAEFTVKYDQGKFNVVLDFIGGYDILGHSSDLIHSGGVYLTTVGDYVGNYSEDVFNSWDNPSANARKMFGTMLWKYNYIHFYFDTNAKNAKKNDWLQKCGELLANDEVKCVVDKVYDWKDHKEAFSYMATQRAQGKLILKVEKF